MRESAPDPVASVSVLLAEDEVLVRLHVGNILRGAGFQVFEAADADEAIAILQMMPVDVVVSDLNMGTPTDGLRLARYVRAARPRSKIVLAAARSPPVEEASLFDAFFVKPYQPEEIVRWIKSRPVARLDEDPLEGAST